MKICELNTNTVWLHQDEELHPLSLHGKKPQSNKSGVEHLPAAGGVGGWESQQRTQTSPSVSWNHKKKNRIVHSVFNKSWIDLWQLKLKGHICGSACFKALTTNQVWFVSSHHFPKLLVNSLKIVTTEIYVSVCIWETAMEGFRKLHSTYNVQNIKIKRAF